MSAVGPGLPVVAVVGRPNVGKSSLVNRVLGRREAIVQQTPGVTRDRTGFPAEWAGRDFEIIDTGGLEPGVDGLEAQVAEQAQLAIEIADVIVLVVDVLAGPDQDDLRVADMLRRAGKPVVVAANKADDPSHEPLAASFYRLGLGDPHAVSALHGRGSGDLLEAVVAALPDAPRSREDAWGAVAIVGRPNVGKSSLLNALLGEYRALVDPKPGTTRDPVDSYLALEGLGNLKIVDTAGMRREVKIKDSIEYFGWLRSRHTLARVDAAVLVVDVAEGVTGHDQRIAQAVLASGRACVVVLNKWDLATTDEADRTRLERDIGTRLRFVPWATIVRTSATTRRGVDRVLPAVTEAISWHRHRMTTAALNRVIQEAQELRPHPRSGPRAVRVLYGLQAAASPPKFLLFATGRVETGYVRYLEHRIRSAEGFAGTPLNVQVRQRTRREVEG